MKELIKFIIAFVFLIWFIASLVFMVVSAKTEGRGWLVPVVLGQFLFVFGLLALINAASERSKHIWSGALAMLAGASSAAFGAVYHFGSGDTKQTVTALIPVIFGMAMVTAGLCGMIITLRTRQKGLANYKRHIEGRCIELKKRQGKGHKLYSPVYEIELDGQTVRLENEVYSSMDIPKVGEVRELYISEAELPGYTEPRFDSRIRTLSLVISAAFIIGGAILTMVSIGKSF